MSNSGEVLAALVEGATFVEGYPILDVGCGDGQDAERIREITDHAVFTLDETESPHLKGHFIGDALNMPFRDESMSMVYASFLYHLVDRKSALIREMARVTRAGGRVAVVTASEAQLASRHLNQYFPSMLEHDVVRYGSVSTLAAHFTIAGLVDVESHTVTVPNAHPKSDFRDVLAMRSWSSLMRIPENERAEGTLRALADLDLDPDLRWSEERTIVRGVRPQA